MLDHHRYRTARRALATLASAALLAGVLAVAEGPAASAAPAATGASVVADDGTRDIDFNSDWTFKLATRTPTVADAASVQLADVPGLATADVIAPSYDDSSWRQVTLPHDFSIEGNKVSSGSNSQAYLQGGLGWYRKTFSVPASFQVARKRVVIDFEGVYQNSNVYLNGELVGNYPSGYTGFAYDITDLLNYGDDESNTIVVKVQNMAPSGRWYTGSGITRPVHLVVTDPVRFVRNGIDLSTPTLKTTYTADHSAELQVDASVYSDATNGVLHTKTTVLRADGTVAAQSESDPVETNPSTLTTVSQSVTVPNVNLWFPWNIGDPYQYTVRTQLYYFGNGSEGDRLVDTVDTKYGFRWFGVQPGSSSDVNAGGLYVNDVYTKIDGVDLHHDSGSLGAASYTDAYARQFSILKSMGVNAYRTSHNPPSKQVIQVASAMGFIVAEEAYDGWGSPKATYDFGKFFLQPVPSDWAGLAPNGLSAVPTPATNYAGAQYLWSDWVIQQMVERDKNEPSVLMWSVGNEVRGVGTKPAWYDVTKYDPGNLVAQGGSALAFNEYSEAVRLGQDIRSLDPNRPVIMGGDQQRSVPAATSTWGRVNKYLDGYGLNYNTATSVDGLINTFPNTFFFESESSSQTSSRGVYLDPTLLNTGSNLTPGKRGGSNYDNDFASWTMSNEYGLKKDRDRKGFAGQFIWSGFDYLGEPTPYSVFPVGVSSFGAIDTAGFPKDSYYLFRSQFLSAAQEPNVHIVPGNWTQWREGETVDVWVNSNEPTVELTLNGQSLGKKSFDVKKTAYGKQYLETSEPIADDKSWPAGSNAGNTGGYASNGATVVTANGDSAIPAGTTYGKLHLTWKVPFAKGVLQAKAYASPTSTTPVAVDTVTTAGSPYTIKLSASKSVLKADGQSLSYIEADVVDEDGNIVPNADNLLTFDVAGSGAIVGVDNGRQESSEPYKWDGLDRNDHSERSAYMGKALAIVQSTKGETGPIQLTVRADGLQPSVVTLGATADGTGSAPTQVTVTPKKAQPQSIALGVPAGSTPTLPADVRVSYTDATVGSFDLVKPVTWAMPSASSFTSPGELTITGVVAGVSTPVRAYVSVVPTSGRGNIAANPTLGNNNVTYRFEDLAADDPLRGGALATASFSGSASLLPNNVLNGNTAQAWGNTYSRGATVLLPAVTASRPFEQLELFWDKARTFDEVDLSFVTTTGKAVPSALTVEYWDGVAWRPVSGLAKTGTTETKLTFTSVLASRVRVGMTNGTPYTANGNLQVTTAGVFGPLTTGAVVKAGLRQAQDDAAALDETDYSPASWAALQAAVADGDEVVADANATSADVTAATEAIRTAIEALVAADLPAPVVVDAPAISGSPVVGQTLTVSDGTWNPSADLTFHYQWKADGTAIAGATDPTFDVTAAQVGARITATVSVSRTGYATGSITTAATAEVSLPKITSVKAPKISGEAVVGKTLTASNGTWDPATGLTYSYAWKADDVAIPGATTSTFVLPAAQAGKAITVTVTAHRAGYQDGSATSQDTDPVSPVITSVTAPAVTGEAVVGKTLTASTGTWDPATGLTYSYAWSADGNVIGGATGSTLQLAAAQVGTHVTVTVTASRTGYVSATATSTATAAVVLPTIVSVTAPAVTGEAVVGKTLTASTGTWDPATGLTYSYAWKADGTAIADATGDTLELAAAQAGKQITVTVTASRDGYNDASATSQPSSAVIPVITSVAAPAVTGDAVVGKTLTASAGTWDPATGLTYSYAWSADGTVISGASGPTFVLTAAQLGKRVTVSVTASAAGYVSASATSSPSAVVTEQITVATAPAISGKVVVGQTVTSSPGTWSVFGVSLAYQWYANGTAVKGATARTLKVSSALVGKKLTVRVTATKVGYLSAVSTSAASAAVSKAASKVALTVKPKKATTKKKVKVTVKVSAAGVSGLTGKVKVTYGKKSVTKTLTAKAKGKVTLKLARLKKGTVKVKAVYTPTSSAAKAVKKGTSKVVKVKVKK